MSEIDYHKDYVVTWSTESQGSLIQEGFTAQQLSAWEGDNALERIQTMYNDFNNNRSPGKKRTIEKVEKVSVEIIYKKL